jgi:hypothetical protein
MSIFRMPRLGLTALVLLPCLSLPAAGPVHYGFSAHVDFPMSNLDTDLNGKVGAGASFQVSIETSERTIIRPRVDLDVFPVSEHNRPDSTFRDRVDLGSLGVGADFLYAFSGQNSHGLYGLGGVGLQRWVETWSSYDTEGHRGWERDDSVGNRTSPWLAVGLGYQFNPIVGLEGRVVGSHYDAISADTSGTRTAVVTQVALTCRW